MRFERNNIIIVKLSACLSVVLIVIYIYIYELSCKNFNVTLTMAEDDT